MPLEHYPVVFVAVTWSRVDSCRSDGSKSINEAMPSFFQTSCSNVWVVFQYVDDIIEWTINGLVAGFLPVVVFQYVDGEAGSLGCRLNTIRSPLPLSPGRGR